MNKITIARIQAYYEETQTVDVMTLCNPFSKVIGVSHAPSKPTLIKDLPIVHPTTAGHCIALEPSVGDTCILMVPDRGVSHWMDEGRTEYEAEEGIPEHAAMRQDSLSDAFVMLGVNPFDTKVPLDRDGLVIRSRDGLQMIQLHNNGDISITSPSKVTVTSPEVFVEATDATVQAETLTATVTTLTATAETATVDATVSATLTSPAVTIDAAATTITGSLAVGGGLSVSGGGTASGGFSVDSLDASDVTAGSSTIGGIDFASHVHAGVTSGGSTTAPPQ